MILLVITVMYIASIVTVCGLGVVFLAVSNLMENDLWFIAFLDFIVTLVLLLELTSVWHFIEGVRHKNLFVMEITALHI
jgi:hypothetical protein